MDTLQKIKFRIKAGISGAEDEYNRRVNDRVLIPGLQGLHGEKLYITDYQALLNKAEEPLEESDGTKWLDISPFVDYMLDVFEQCIMNAFLSENELTDHEKLILQKMNKKGTGAEITVQNDMKITGLSETTSRKILNSLSNKGYLRIEKGTKRYIYSLIAGLGGD